MFPDNQDIKQESTCRTVGQKWYYSRIVPNRSTRLRLEGEAGANLVGGLVQVLGIKGSTKAEGDTRAQQNVVSQGGNTTVIDLGLYGNRVSLPCKGPFAQQLTLAKEEGSSLYLLATSRPTELPALESQVALAPASTCWLTRW